MKLNNVDRLVYRRITPNAAPLKIRLQFIADIDEHTFNGLTDIFNTLCAYEETGLTPAEIKYLMAERDKQAEQLKEETSRRYQAECNYDVWKQKALLYTEAEETDELKQSKQVDYRVKLFKRNGINQYFVCTDVEEEKELYSILGSGLGVYEVDIDSIRDITLLRGLSLKDLKKLIDNM